MNRIMIGLLVLLSVNACSLGESDPGQAEAMKSNVDSAVRDTLPDLARELGATMPLGMRGRFTECSVSGSWNYLATTDLVMAPGDGPAEAQGIERVFTDQGFELVDSTVETGIRAERDLATVIVSPKIDTTAGDSGSRKVMVSTGCTALSGKAADFAKQAQETDFSELVPAG